MNINKVILTVHFVQKPRLIEGTNQVDFILETIDGQDSFYFRYSKRVFKYIFKDLLTKLEDKDFIDIDFEINGHLINNNGKEHNELELKIYSISELLEENNKTKSKLENIGTPIVHPDFTDTAQSTSSIPELEDEDKIDKDLANADQNFKKGSIGKFNISSTKDKNNATEESTDIKKDSEGDEEKHEKQHEEPLIPKKQLH